MAVNKETIPQAVCVEAHPDEDGHDQISLFWEKINFSVPDPEKKVASQGEYMATDTKPGVKENGEGNEQPNSKNLFESFR